MYTRSPGAPCCREERRQSGIDFRFGSCGFLLRFPFEIRNLHAIVEARRIVRIRPRGWRNPQRFCAPCISGHGVGLILVTESDRAQRKRCRCPCSRACRMTVCPTPRACTRVAPRARVTCVGARVRFPRGCGAVMLRSALENRGAPAPGAMQRAPGPRACPHRVLTSLAAANGAPRPPSPPCASSPSLLQRSWSPRRTWTSPGCAHRASHSCRSPPGSLPSSK